MMAFSSRTPPGGATQQLLPLARRIRTAGGISVAAMLSIAGCGSSCFRSGTRIATRRGAVPIDKIQVGMMVLSYDLTSQQVVERLVTRHFTHTPRLTGGLANLRGVTSNHPIFDAATGRFKPAGDFLGGEVLLRLHGETTPVPLGAFSYDEMAPQPVYNLSVEETQTYFADGVLVHNKSDCDFCEPITGTGGREIGRAHV